MIRVINSKSNWWLIHTSIEWMEFLDFKKYNPTFLLVYFLQASSCLWSGLRREYLGYLGSSHPKTPRTLPPLLGPSSDTNDCTEREINTLKNNRRLIEFIILEIIQTECRVMEEAKFDYAITIALLDVVSLRVWKFVRQCVKCIEMLYFDSLFILTLDVDRSTPKSERDMQGGRKMLDFSKMHHDNKLWTGEHLNSEREINFCSMPKKWRRKCHKNCPCISTARNVSFMSPYFQHNNNLLRSK